MPTFLNDLLINERYGLLREIGRGPTGVVYAAWDQDLEREVAVKVLDAKFTRRREIIAGFEWEICCSARLQHPGLVTVFESGKLPDGSLCYVMSLAKGRNLAEHLKRLRMSGEHLRSGALIDRISLFLRLLEVVTYAHSQKIVHRDLNPGNIMLGDFGEVWILDWGLARDLAEGKDSLFNPEKSYDRLFGTSLPSSGGVMAAPGQSGADTRGAETLLLPTSEITRDPSINGRHEHIIGQLTGQAVNPAKRAPLTGKYATRLSWKPQTAAVHLAAHSGSTSVIRKSVGDGDELTDDMDVGSPAYMSPELIRDEAVDERADIYSVGVILFELLTMETPTRVDSKESTAAYIRRAKTAKRRSLTDLWPEAPAGLARICDKALADAPESRYRSCAEMSADLHVLLDELSKSFSELELQRLALEREADWTSLGKRDFGKSDDLSPCIEAPIARRSEPVGQVLHPEMGGMLIGGWGLQVYPVSLSVGDDMRLTIELNVLQGSEIWLFLRGVPPAACYVIKIGAYGGRWLAVCKANGESDLIDCEIVTMRPLRMQDTATIVDPNAKAGLGDCRVAIEMVGTKITLTYNDQEPLIAHDPCPISGPLNRQLAIGTWESHALVRKIEVHQRRAPLMLPSFSIGSELLRQKLYPQAIDSYRRFLAEHPDNEYAVEAKFMLCLAFIQMQRHGEAERQLRDFLSAHHEHPVAQDAVCELAKLIMQQSGDLQRAVRAVLSYQDADDFVRSRFCMLLLNAMYQTTRAVGPTENTFNVLSMVRTLMRGSPDEGAITATMSVMLGRATRYYLHRVIDMEAQEEIERVRDLVASIEHLGFVLPGCARKTAFEYLATAHRLMVRNDPAETRLAVRLGERDPDKMVYFVHDVLHYIAVGAHAQILAILDEDELRPIEQVFKVGLLFKAGRQEDAYIALNRCYHFVDVIETERSDLSLRFAARIGAYGLGLLPWSLLWQSMTKDPLDRYLAPLEIMSGWFAECLGHDKEAKEAYRWGTTVGTGFRGLCLQALKRLGADG